MILQVRHSKGVSRHKFRRDEINAIMKTIKEVIGDIRQSLYNDLLNRYVSLAQIVLLIASSVIWLKVIQARNVYVYSATNFFPIQVYIVVFILHLILSVYSYKNDRNISNLLLASGLFYIVLIIILELLYIIYQ